MSKGKKMIAILKRTFIYLISILFICLVISIIIFSMNFDSSIVFSTRFYNTIFLINTLLFCVAILEFVTEQGFFNSLRYSVVHVRTTISAKYRFTFMESNDLKDKASINEYLKENYLYKLPKFRSTFPLLGSTTIIFIGQLIATSIFY